MRRLSSRFAASISANHKGRIQRTLAEFMRHGLQFAFETDETKVRNIVEELEYT